MIKHLVNFSCFTIKRIVGNWLSQRKNLHWNIIWLLICNFLGYSYKRLVIVKKTIKSFFKKIGFETQNNIETSLSQASASYPESLTCVDYSQSQMKCHQTKTRRDESKNLDLFSIACDLRLHQSICNYFMQQKDEIHWAYIRAKSYQLTPSNSSNYINKNDEFTPQIWNPKSLTTCIIYSKDKFISSFQAPT